MPLGEREGRSHQVVDLPIATHAITIRAVVPKPAPRWDWWRVKVTINQRSEVIERPRNEPLKLIGIAGTAADLRACVLEPVHLKTELGCTTTRVRFDRDRTLNVSIPLGP